MRENGARSTQRIELLLIVELTLRMTNRLQNPALANVLLGRVVVARTEEILMVDQDLSFTLLSLENTSQIILLANDVRREDKQ